jgi:hypothetical protein
MGHPLSVRFIFEAMQGKEPRMDTDRHGFEKEPLELLFILT